MLKVVHTSPKPSPLQPVLVVESDPVNQQRLKAYLENDLALDVHLAANATTAAGLLNANVYAQHQYQFILISGLQEALLPHDRGPHIARRIFDMPAYKNIPVYGASADRTYWAPVLHQRTFTFLEMPFDTVAEALRWDIPALAGHFNKRAA